MAADMTISGHNPKLTSVNCQLDTNAIRGPAINEAKDISIVAITLVVSPFIVVESTANF